MAAPSTEDGRIAAAFAYLDEHTNRGVVPGPERIRWLCSQLGEPQRAAPAVHVTGTNGKGSTSRLVSSLLSRLGRRTALYTSPHLVDITERIAVDRVPISRSSFADHMLRLVPLFDQVATHVKPGPTYFEILTVIGLDYFTTQGVDAMVIEVGLGGRLDTTNVVDGRVAVITNVDLDHTHYLGTRREDHATEKAGIIKPGAIAVIGERDPGLAGIVAARAAQVEAVSWRMGKELDLLSDRMIETGRLVTIRTPGALYRDVQVPFHGPHQARNAAVALGAAEAFVGGPIDPDAVAAAWASVTNPGRFEIFGDDPPVVVDVAHNPHGIGALVTALDERFPDRDRVAVLGVNPDKDLRGMLDRLAPAVGTLVTTQAPAGGSVTADELAKTAEAAGYRVEAAIADPLRALRGARRLATPDGIVVCTGSHYWLGDVYPSLTAGEPAGGPLP